MLDSQYFQTDLRAQVATVGDNPVVRIRLHSGEELIVRGVDQIRPGYVMLNVYPHDSAASFHSPSHYDVAQAPSNPVAIPYETIAEVIVSNTTVDQRPRIGFVG